MFNSVSTENVIYFHDCFSCYGFPGYESKLLAWILHNFAFWHETKLEVFNSHILAHIEKNLMEKLLAHEDFVMKSEMTLYNILKRWLVDKMKLRDDYDYVKTWNRPEPFLATQEGKKYERVFSKLNLKQFCMDAGVIEQLTKDNILPVSWLHKAADENYRRLVYGSSDGSAIYRLGIIHGPNECIFRVTSISVEGIHLEFSWASNALVLTRLQNLSGLSYSGSVRIRFCVSFHKPNDFETGTWMVGAFEVKKDFSAPIFAWDRSYEDLVSSQVCGLPSFPRIIGIRMEVTK